jgi:hypothetical protein
MVLGRRGGEDHSRSFRPLEEKGFCRLQRDEPRNRGLYDGEQSFRGLRYSGPANSRGVSYFRKVLPDRKGISQTSANGNRVLSAFVTSRNKVRLCPVTRRAKHPDFHIVFKQGKGSQIVYRRGGDFLSVGTFHL